MREIENESSKGERFLPIVGPVKGNFLYMLTKISQARNILDVGTLTGYSALLLAKGAGPKGRIITIENDKTFFEEAVKNFRKSGARNIRQRFGDATKILRTLDAGKFDLIFLDIWKEDYVKVLDDCVRVLKKNGLLVADNVLWEAEPLKQWRTVIFNNKHLISFLVPLADGMSVSMKIK